jgi:TolA-binding protein
MKKAAAVLLLAACGLAAQAQEASVPFVSRLKAQAGPASVVLTWREASGPSGVRKVYRASREIDQATFPAATEIASVPAGVSRYEDSPPGRGPWYYAVLVTSADGLPYRLFIQFRNKTSEPVELTGLAEQTPAGLHGVPEAAAPPVPASEPAPAAAETHGPASPAAGACEPAAAQPAPVQPPEAEPAAASASRPPPAPAQTPAVQSTPPTLTAAGAAARPGEAAGEPRPAPLPYLAPEAGLAGSSPSLPALRPLGAETQRAVDALLANAPPVRAAGLSAQALPEDLQSSDDPAGRELRAILEEHLLAGDFEGAKARLLAYLGAPHGQAEAARAHFYLGQAYFLQGSYDKSVPELLLARDRYYAAVEPWLDAGLVRLREP